MDISFITARKNLSDPLSLGKHQTKEKRRANMARRLMRLRVFNLILWPMPP
jgi:hypothetical protein